MDSTIAFIAVVVCIIGGILISAYRDARPVKRGRYTKGQRTRSTPYTPSDSSGGVYSDFDGGGDGGGGD